VSAVAFANADAPAPVAACVREEIESRWLPGVSLEQEVVLRVSLAIGGRASVGAGAY